METFFEATYVMPYIHTPNNFKILKRSINELQSLFERIQVLIVETGSSPRLKNMNLRADYMFLESDIWNIGWMFNCAMQSTRSDKLFFGSFDYIPRNDLIKKVLDDDINGIVLLQEGVCYVTEEDIKNQKIPLPIKTTYEGITYMTKEFYSRIGGWEENILGEKMYEIQHKRNTKLVPTQQIGGHNVYRLRIDLPINAGKYVQDSERYYERLSNLEDSKLINYVKVQGKKLGNKQKYDLMDVSDIDI